MAPGQPPGRALCAGLRRRSACSATPTAASCWSWRSAACDVAHAHRRDNRAPYAGSLPTARAVDLARAAGRLRRPSWSRCCPTIRRGSRAGEEVPALTLRGAEPRGAQGGHGQAPRADPGVPRHQLRVRYRPRLRARRGRARDPRHATTSPPRRRGREPSSAMAEAHRAQPDGRHPRRLLRRRRAGRLRQVHHRVLPQPRPSPRPCASCCTSATA